MLKILFPISLVLIAGVVFFFFTNPLIVAESSTDSEGKLVGGVMALMDEQSFYSQAMRESENLKGRLLDLQTQLNRLSPTQISRLDTFLPDELDEIQLIVDVNNIARGSGMAIGEISFSSGGNQPARGQAQAPASTGSPQVNPLSMSFSVVGNYSQLKSFLNDLSRSLRIIDVDSLSFSLSEEGLTRYNLRITTYWLN